MKLKKLSDEELKKILIKNKIKTSKNFSIECWDIGRYETINREKIEKLKDALDVYEITYNLEKGSAYFELEHYDDEIVCRLKSNTQVPLSREEMIGLTESLFERQFYERRQYEELKKKFETNS